MKKILSYCMLLLSIAAFSQNKAQKARPCLTDAIYESELKNNPGAKDLLKQFDLGLKEKLDNNQNFKTNSWPMVTIPVMFYIVYDPAIPSSNIPDSQVDSQLDALNDYFFDYGIKFCKATKAGTSPLNAISRFGVASLASHDSATEQAALVNLTGNATADKYLRIWIVNTIDGPTSPIQAYSSLAPYVSFAFDGIVIKNSVFGNENDPLCNCSLLYRKNTGKTLVHEIGHYLGLFHTFAGGCSTPNNNCLLDGDHICDTPAVASANYECVAGTNSCTDSPVDNPDHLINYMDYGDDNCVSVFTAGQADRMHYMLDTARSTLISNSNQIYTGTCGYANLVTANWDAVPFTVCSTNGTVNFSTVSGPTLQYSWNFGDPYATGANANTSSAQNPSHIFNNPAGSPYTVTLTVTNTTTMATATRTDKIYVTSCGTIGNENSYWWVGNSHGLQFSSGIPAFDPSFPTTSNTQGTPAIQNTSGGSLLFYANRLKVYNNLHTQIGSNLAYSSGFGDSVLIVPKPASLTNYYIFTNTWTQEFPVVESGFRYNTVQVSGGTTTMTSTRVPVTQPSNLNLSVATDGALAGGNGVTAIRKCNGEYWIITTIYNNVVVYHLSNAGLVYSSQAPLPVFANPAAWTVEASPSGNKLFVHMRLLETATSHNCLFDFNKANGIVSSTYTPIKGDYVTGAAFSPDSKLLYTVEQFRGIISQYNLTILNVNSTKTVVVTAQPNQTFSSIQRGPDEKLYIGSQTSLNELAVIHNPNTVMNLDQNITCNYSHHGPRRAYNASNLLLGSLPNLIETTQASAYPGTGSSVSYYPTGCGAYKFFPDFCGTSFSWNFGDGSPNSTDTNPIHTFPGAGTFTVTLYNSLNALIAQTNVVITGMPVPTIYGGSSICGAGNGTRTTNNSINLQPGQTVVWSIIPSSAGSISGPNNQPSVDVNWTTTGTLSVVVTGSTGCNATSSINITETNITPTISDDNFCFKTGDYSTAHTTATIPTGYSAQWTFENGILGGTFSTPTNLATVGVNWAPGTGFGYLGVTLMNPGGCVFQGQKTVYDQCICSCFSTRTYTYTKSNLTITIATGNSDPSCAGGPSGGTRYNYGDGTSGYSAVHTYAAAGSYTVTITGMMKGAFDETICSGPAITLPVSVNCKYCLERGSSNTNLTIYPNPASSTLNIDVVYNSAAPLEVVLKSIDGKELLKKKWMMKKGKNDLQLEIPNNLSEGMIFVEIISDEIKETKTVIIKK
jgi:PKD repeat protein